MYIEIHKINGITMYVFAFSNRLTYSGWINDIVNLPVAEDQRYCKDVMLLAGILEGRVKTRIKGSVEETYTYLDENEISKFICILLHGCALYKAMIGNLQQVITGMSLQMKPSVNRPIDYSKVPSMSLDDSPIILR